MKFFSRISEKVRKHVFLDGKEEKQSKITQFSNFLENQFYRKAIAFDKIGGNYVLPTNSIKNMLIKEFLHAEFISVIKTVQNPTIFMKNAKNKKMNNFGNLC